MPCDRCGGAMDTYELDGRDARSCRECGYVDVPVRHEPEGGHRESWDDAISRFQEQYADVTVSEVGLPPETTADESVEAAMAEESPSEPTDEESSEDAPGEESSEDAPGEESSEGSSEELSASESPEEASATDD